MLLFAMMMVSEQPFLLQVMNAYSWHKERGLLIWHSVDTPLGGKGPERSYKAKDLEEAVKMVSEFNMDSWVTIREEA